MSVHAGVWYDDELHPLGLRTRDPTITRTSKGNSYGYPCKLYLELLCRHGQLRSMYELHVRHKLTSYTHLRSRPLCLIAWHGRATSSSWLSTLRSYRLLYVFEATPSRHLLICSAVLLLPRDCQSNARRSRQALLRRRRCEAKPTCCKGRMGAGNWRRSGCDCGNRQHV